MLYIINLANSTFLPKGLVGRMRDCNKMRFRKLVNNEKQMLKMAKDNMTCKQKKFEELEEYSKGKIEQISTLIDCITKLFTRSISTALHVAFCKSCNTTQQT